MTPSPDGPPGLHVQGLEKAYGDRQVLRGVDLTVHPGESLALLGENGAGKSTLLNVVVGLRRIDRGRVTVDGFDIVKHPSEARRLIGYAPQDVGLYPVLPVERNLRFFAKLAGVPEPQGNGRMDLIAGALGLSDLMGRRVDRLSGGQRRRVHVAIAFLHEPRLVILDEPTTSLDAEGRRLLADLVRDTCRRGSAVFHATHSFGDVEASGASIAVLDVGRVVARGTMADLVSRYGESYVKLVFEEVPSSTPHGFRVVEDHGRTITISAVDPNRVAAEVLARCALDGDRVRSVEIVRPTLAAVFTAITGRVLEEDPEQQRVGAS